MYRYKLLSDFLLKRIEVLAKDLKGLINPVFK